ncbi:patatin-like phospholipase family protein [Floccifex sp.]|uniref:patatin-like phospholipase family protein n=1 Tax=Floccifex sp. TaxID=2815810 RepID=UPI003F050C00
MKTGIIDVGGGMRGIYAAGVFDALLDMHIEMDCCIGVSAGSANIVSYLSKQRKRNYVYYTEYSERKEYMSLYNFIHKKEYIDLEYVYGTLSNTNGEYPVDYRTFSQNSSSFFVVATNANTGKPMYFSKEDVHLDDFRILKASCAIPFVCKPQQVYDEYYFDGALSDCVPISFAKEQGCTHIILILTKPVEVIRTSKKDKIIASLIQKKYPESAQALIHRADCYNQAIEKAKKDENICIIAPKDTFGVDTLTKDQKAMDLLYLQGYKDAHKIELFLKKKNLI